MNRVTSCAMQIQPEHRRKAAKFVRALMLVAFGATAMLFYVTAKYPDLSGPLRILDAKFRLIFFGLLLLWGWLNPNIKNEPEPTPRWSGVNVVILTGVGVAVMIHKWMPAGTALIGDGIVLIATAAVAMVVWRFATAHADDIGEARFPTS